MNKKWKFASFVLTCALFCGVAGTTFVGCKDYDDDIDGLKGQIEELKSGSISSLNQQVEGLKKSVTALEGTDADLKAAIAALEGAKNDYVAADAALKSALEATINGKVDQNAYDAAVKSLKDQDGVLLAEITALKELNQLVSDLQTGKLDKSEFAAKVEEITTSMNTQLSEIVAQLGDKADKSDLDALTARVEQVENDYTALVATLKDYATKEDLDKAVKALASEQAELIAEINGKIAELDERKANVTDAKEWIAEAVTGLEKQIEVSEKALKGDISANKQAIEENAGLIAELATNLNKLEENLVANYTTLAKAEELIKAAKDEVSKTLGEAFQNELNGVKASVEKLQAKVQLDSVALAEEINTLRASMEDSIVNVKAAITALDKRLTDVNDIAVEAKELAEMINRTLATTISDAIKDARLEGTQLKIDIENLIDRKYKGASETLADRLVAIESRLDNVEGRITLTYIPENFHPVVGRVAYLPVIVTDDNSQEKKVYEYNWDNKDFATSMVKGWTAMKYKVNPSNAQLNKDFAVVGFDYNLMNILTRSADNYLEAGKATYADGVVSVEFRDLIPLDNGTDYDDPDKESGYKSEYGEAKVGQIALVTKNLRNVEEKVTSDYTSIRRMAVLQQDVMIGIAVGDNKILNEKANPFTNLSDMYKVGEKDVNGYLKSSDNVPVIAEVIWNTEPKLDDYIKDYALTFRTNDDFESTPGQYRLEALGFKNIDFKYYIEGYEAAEVDQTKRYLDLDEETGLIKVKEDPEKPGEKQHAAIDREPIIKVKMFVDGEWIMSKLLKIKFVEKAQLTPEPWTDTDLKAQTLGCTALIGGGEALTTAPSFTGAEKVEGLKIDFDKYFNRLGVSKQKFVELYSDGGITGMETAIKVTKDGSDFTDWSMDATADKNLIFDASSIYGDAVNNNNYVYLGLRNQLKAGVYKIDFTFSTKSTIAAYKSFTITTSFTVIDPLPMWQANPSMWAPNREYMLAYGVATATESEGKTPYIAPYEGPFLMKVAIEDGFMREMKNDSDLKCAHYCFELVDPDQYKGEVSISYDEKEKRHYLTIAQYKDKWVGKKIKVHAFANVTGDHGAKTRTIDVNVDATSSDVFDIMFVDPVSYEENEDYAKNWYLVDKALTTVKDKGAYLPVYELFKLWDTTLGETNGTMWDGNNWVAVDAIEKGRSLYLMHHVNVTYTLSAKNDPYVLKRASLDEKTGVLKWNNTEGALVGEIDQPIIVEVNIAHQWRAKAVRKELTVFVKKAETAYKQTWPGKENITVANPYGVPGQNDLEILKRN